MRYRIIVENARKNPSVWWSWCAIQQIGYISILFYRKGIQYFNKLTIVWGKTWCARCAHFERGKLAYSFNERLKARFHTGVNFSTTLNVCVWVSEWVTIFDRTINEITDNHYYSDDFNFFCFFRSTDELSFSRVGIKNDRLHSIALKFACKKNTKTKKFCFFLSLRIEWKYV